MELVTKFKKILLIYALLNVIFSNAEKSTFIMAFESFTNEFMEESTSVSD
jgi:hypothetical protein